MTNPCVVPTFGRCRTTEVGVPRWARRSPVLALLALTACTSTDVVGTWVGKDHGADLIYTFKPDGTGFRSLDSQQLAITYELKRGYPNRILISVGGPPASQVSQGLVRISWDDRM